MSRGCGVRSPGGIYIEVPLVAGGSPIENFMVDPCRELPYGIDLMPRGITILERIVNGTGTGIYDVWDVVGAKFYPNVWDFIHETRKKGLSRRVQAKAEFAKLSPDSRIILVHPRAVVLNAHQGYQALAAEKYDYPHFAEMIWSCPCGIGEHANYPLYSVGSNDQMRTCIGLHRHLITGGEAVLNPDFPPRTVERKIGNLSYMGRERPKTFSPEFTHGMFLILPIYNLAVIRDPEGGEDVKAMERATASSLHVELQDA